MKTIESVDSNLSRMNATDKNQVLASMVTLLDTYRGAILKANEKDVDSYNGSDQAMYDRLKIDHAKVDTMIHSVEAVREKADPIYIEKFRYTHPQGFEVYNRTAPFGTILIIYESRPDVTVEAASLAFKAGNKILLKGGKEALHSNLILVELWHKALVENGWDSIWIQYLNFTRAETQALLRSDNLEADLIVPRGGEQLISFVKEHAKVPVLVSGRGNNFAYVHNDANWENALQIILNAKMQKISACNALDKVLIHEELPQLTDRLHTLIKSLQAEQVEIIVDRKVQCLVPKVQVAVISNANIWEEEFLAKKIVIGLISDESSAIEKINTYSGKHSVSILTKSDTLAQYFMDQIDAAAVYHNASTRFTDGGQFGLGAELAISTDKLHHRGPLGLEHLVTNKWYVYGNGQVRI